MDGWKMHLINKRRAPNKRRVYEAEFSINAPGFNRENTVSGIKEGGGLANSFVIRQPSDED